MQSLINILVLTALYTMLGQGFVLIYRSTRVFNLAHGDLMMLGGYVFFTFLVAIEGNLWLAVTLSLVSGFLIGGMVYQIGIRPLAGYSVAAIVLMTVAIGILIRSLATIIWSAQTRYPVHELPFEDKPIRLMENMVVSTIDIASLVAAAIFLVLLILMLQWTSLGIRMRAVAEQPTLAAYSGINIHRAIALSWGLSCFGATLAAVFYTTRVDLQPDSWIVGLHAFTPALIGGMDSHIGVLPGALLVATVQVLAAEHLDPIMVNTAPFAVLLIALWIRPWGFFGSREEVERV